MVCIAAFILLAVCVLAVPVIRLFNKPVADSIWKMFKKSIYCFTHRVTFRKCDSTFKSDIKNSILRRVVIKHPDWVKPLSILIEVLSVLIIVVTVWSLLVAFKAAVSLTAYGTCDPVTPEACAVGDAEACYTGEAKQFDNPVDWTINWFAEIGEAFVAIPPKFTHWEAKDYLPENVSYYNEFDNNKPTALDIFDPGCKWCRESFKAQSTAGFFDQNNVALLPYSIQQNGEYQFKNSDLVVRYLEAVKLIPLDNAQRPPEWQIVERLFTTNSPRQIVWQEDFNNYYSDGEAREILNDWLKDFGYSAADVKKITSLVDSPEIRATIDKNREIVENQIKIVKIPTMIYDGVRHEGLFKQ
ncbi:MAG: hypothetical protein LBL08_01660 [Candidatus Nomurabacteria bacterium]|jgi:hypothetical protein|nr:hypothetical protein [Candidatus Nomurabacteria bacterium]